MNEQILIYGAGNNAKILWGDGKCDESIKKVFENAVGFIDKDPNKKDTIYLGKPVYSIEEGIMKYPKAQIYVSIYVNDDACKEVYDSLIRVGVQHSQILNIRQTCNYLEYFLVCGNHEAAFGGKVGDDAGCHSFKPCCSDYGKNQVDYVVIEDNLEDSFNKYLILRNEILSKLKNAEPCCCTDCPMLRWTVDTISKKFYYLIFNEMGRCNCKCSYCNYQERLGRDVSNDVDIVELYNILCEKGFDKQEGIIELCNGEITIHPDKKRIYEELQDIKIMFLTNGLVKDDEIAKRMKNGDGILNVSIDAGTRETFLAVKGVDAFERVRDNLRFYATNKKGKIYLKYILLPGTNDNENDIKEFVNFCKELSVDAAHISYNLNLEYSDYNNAKIIKALKMLVNLLKDGGIPYEIYSEGVLEALLKEA